MPQDKIIQSLWIGQHLSIIEQLCIQSFICNGHEFHLYTYGEILNVPTGTKVLDANEIISCTDIFKDNRGGVASFSDWFRYKLLYMKGNIWTDMDMICLKPIFIADEYCFSSERTLNGNNTVNNGFLKSPPKSDFFKDVLSYIKKMGKENVIWGSFGPSLIQLIHRYYDGAKFIKEPDVFCPIDYWQVEKLVANEMVTIPENTLAIHLWNEMWRLHKLDKCKTYSYNSLIEILKRRYVVYG